ncbi:MAG: hypothetical protein ACI9VN_001805 [Patescibacteria group bacterium]
MTYVRNQFGFSPSLSPLRLLNGRFFNRNSAT